MRWILNGCFAFLKWRLDRFAYFEVDIGSQIFEIDIGCVSIFEMDIGCVSLYQLLSVACDSF